MAVLWKTVALALSFTVALGTKYKEGDKVENWVFIFFIFRILLSEKQILLMQK